MFDGSYPPGVKGWMLDDMQDPIELPEECYCCRFFEERTCGQICSILEAEYSDTAIGDMTDDEYMEKFGKEPHDTCSDFERWEDD